MNTIRVIAIAATLLTAVASQAATDSGYDQYRRVVLGDSSVAAPAGQQVGNQARLVQVPGSYAQYLIVNGTAADQAIATAARNGESAQYRLQTREVSRQPLNAIAAHEKFLGKSDYATRADTQSAE
jgi:hypothetical protein